MAEQKTKPTDANVDSFLKSIGDAQRREDALQVLKIMKEVTGLPPRMWGPSMVGIGECHYVYASGHEGDTFRIGFSPRKSALTLYFMCGLDQRFADQIKKLGKVTTGKGCLYVKKLADVDLGVLRDMIRENMAYVAALAKPAAKPAKNKKGKG